MSEEEFRSLISNIREKEYKKSIEADKEAAEDEYQESKSEVEAFKAYEVFIKEYMPKIIETVAKSNSKDISFHPGKKLHFHIYISESHTHDQEFNKRKTTNYVSSITMDDFSIGVNRSLTYDVYGYIRNFFKMYGSVVEVSGEKSFYVSDTITRLYRAYMLEKNHGLDYLRSKLKDTYSEEYDGSLNIPTGDGEKPKTM